jgi:hypothetical protein
MAASCQNKFGFGQIINFLASRPTNRNISLWALAQTTTTAAQQFPAAASPGLRAFYSAPSLSLKKRKKLLSGDNTIEVPSLPMDFL